MKVILLEKVQNLGDLGQVVNVKPGYARNYLVPNSMATAANEKNLKALDGRRAELEKKAAEVLATAQKRGGELTDKVVTITSKCGDEGKLFGSISPRDVANAITAAGVKVEKKEVSMPEGPIHNTGEYSIAIHLHSDVVASVKINVVPEAE